MMDTQRLILFIIFSFSLIMLWEAWQKENRPPPAPTAATQTAPQAGGTVPGPAATKADNAAPAPASTPATVPGTATPDAAGASRQRIKVTTDLVAAEIDPVGGDLVRLELLKHKHAVDEGKNLVLLDPEHRYAAQSGFTGNGLPNHKSVYRAARTEYRLEDGKDTVDVRLEADGENGIKAAKIITFRRGSYSIDITHELTNNGSAPIETTAYFHLTRDNRPPPGDQAMLYTFTGPAVYTDATKYTKLSWSDVDKGKPPFPTTTQTDGWVAMVQHYFVSAFIPIAKSNREYYAEKIADGFYRAGFKSPVPAAAPGATVKVTAPLYAGPQEQATLKQLAPGLDLVVDYGWFTVFAQPLFWLLQFFYNWTSNWGWAIVLLTVLIKLVFYPLSAASYKSMAKMKQVTPKLMKMREQYGNDRVKLNQAMMELYKTEKINPLGGCLPIVVQIPVFIALYWTLLGAVELRQAPWLGWIKDLSLPDPWFILPALMMASMVFQTKMNPVPPDPVQAKVMMFMPYVFGVMFFFFPAGLVLYWLVNNILSIAQQWQITKMIEGGKDKPAKA
jgi:YidC/Oxa1 family membrane protein insertase